MAQLQKGLVINMVVDRLDDALHPGQLLRLSDGSKWHIGSKLLHLGSLLWRLVKGHQWVIENDLGPFLAA